MSDEFGLTLEKLMTGRGFTVTQLARKISEPVKSVHEWVGENGRIPRNPAVLRKLAELFNVSVHFLLFGEEDARNTIASLLEKTEIHTGLYEISIKKVIPKT